MDLDLAVRNIFREYVQSTILLDFEPEQCLEKVRDRLMNDYQGYVGPEKSELLLEHIDDRLNGYRSKQQNNAPKAAKESTLHPRTPARPSFPLPPSAPVSHGDLSSAKQPPAGNRPVSPGAQATSGNNFMSNPVSSQTGNAHPTLQHESQPQLTSIPEQPIQSTIPLPVIPPNTQLPPQANSHQTQFQSNGFPTINPRMYAGVANPGGLFYSPQQSGIP
jgi:hypothetical protein